MSFIGLERLSAVLLYTEVVLLGFVEQKLCGGDVLILCGAWDKNMDRNE